MSFSSEAQFDANTPCSGSDCDRDAIVSLDWHVLAMRFVDDVVAADFGVGIEQDLADLNCKLGHFASKSSSRRDVR